MLDGTHQHGLASNEFEAERVEALLLQRLRCLARTALALALALRGLCSTALALAFGALHGLLPQPLVVLQGALTHPRLRVVHPGIVKLTHFVLCE